MGSLLQLLMLRCRIRVPEDYSVQCNDWQPCPVALLLLQGKAAIQSRVQELLTLRTAAKEARTSSLAGAGRWAWAGMPARRCSRGWLCSPCLCRVGPLAQPLQLLLPIMTVLLWHHTKHSWPADENRALPRSPRSSMGGGGAAAAASGSLAGAASGRPRGDPEKRLQERMHELAGVLRDVAKPEEGEQAG